jgi:hypothetical protein
MPSRLAARLLTGPVAFLVAGAIDIVAFLIAALARRTDQRIRWR